MNEKIKAEQPGIGSSSSFVESELARIESGHRRTIWQARAEERR